MRRTLFAALLVMLMTSADAADIIVFSSGVTNGGLKKLAAAWSLETGNKVNIQSGTIGKVKDDVIAGVRGDVVLLPSGELKDISAKLKSGTMVPSGRALFGLVVKAGAPHPDISTIDKFAAALRASSGIGYPDPAAQSLSGLMIEKMLMRREFAGVERKPLLDYAAAMVAKGDAQYAGGTISEELSDPGAELIGPFPAALDMHIDFSAAVLVSAAQPADAVAFVRYITRPEAAAAWNDCGIDAAGKTAQMPRAACFVLAPTIAPPPPDDEVRAPRPARARGIGTSLAVEGAQTAIAACLDNGYKVTALVVDAAGVPIALISGDGAAAITQRIAMGKAQAVLKTKMSSGEAAAKAKSDSAFLTQLTGDPLVGTPRQGGIPIMVGGAMVGAFAVSGAPGGDKDEPCAIAGLAKIQDHLQ